MMSRCYNTKDKDYPSVGGAGVQVYPLWHKFEVFLVCLGERPDNTYLSRKDPRGNFTPENVWWKPKVSSRENRLYTIWRGVKRRANPDTQARNYRDKEVDMDPRWEDFFVFQKDMGEPPTDEHSIERIDNSLGYWPANCVWALPAQQQNNQDRNFWLEVGGERMTLSQWAEATGVPVALLTNRVAHLFDPPAPRKQRVIQKSAEGMFITEFLSAQDAAEKTGLRKATIQKCLSGGNATAGGFCWEYSKEQ